MNDNYGMESQNGPDSFSETEFARAERLSRDLYFASEKLKSFYRMAENGLWIKSTEYSALIDVKVKMFEALRLLLSNDRLMNAMSREEARAVMDAVASGREK